MRPCATVCGRWMFAAMVIGIAAVGSARPEPVDEDSDARTALAAFEQTLERQPNDLRAGADYRQLAIRLGRFDRSIKFLSRLVRAHPDAVNAHLNLALAYVDKVPAVGLLRQIFLGRDAIDAFTEALTIEPSWLAYYCRGLINLYYSRRIFNRTRLGIADLQQALAIQRAGPRRRYHVRTFISLGDGYWKTRDIERARAAWREGLNEFPDDARLKARLTAQGAALDAIVDQALDPDVRVDTSLRPLLEDP